METPTVVEPMASRETRMHVTVSPAFLVLLKEAKAAQSHVQPGATHEQILAAALELLIENQGKRRSLRLDGAAGDRPRRAAREGRPVHCE